LNNPETF